MPFDQPKNQIDAVYRHERAESEKAMGRPWNSAESAAFRLELEGLSPAQLKARVPASVLDGITESGAPSTSSAFGKMDIRNLTPEDSAALAKAVGERMGMTQNEVTRLSGTDKLRYFSAVIDAVKAALPKTPTLDHEPRNSPYDRAGSGGEMRFVSSLTLPLSEAGLRQLPPDLLEAVVERLTEGCAPQWVASSLGLSEKFVRWVAVDGYWLARTVLLHNQQALARQADAARRAIAAEDTVGSGPTKA